MTQEQFQQRWCRGDALCSLPADMEEPPHSHCTAAHFVPLPALCLNYSLPGLENGRLPRPSYMVQYDTPP